MVEHDLQERIAKKLIILSKFSISNIDRNILKNMIYEELKEFNKLDVLKMFFLNKNRYAFPSLFLVLNELWTKVDFQDWLGIIEELDNCLDGLVSWIFYSGQYMGIDGMKAALDSNLLSPTTKELLKQRLKKGTPQPLKRHLDELSKWVIDFNNLHQKMVRSGGPAIQEDHDYYGYFLIKELSNE